MYVKTTLWKRIFFLTGAILFMALIAPLSLKLYVYATAFAAYPDGNMYVNPTMPLQYIAFPPFIALLAGAIAGALWAWVLARIPEKSTDTLLRRIPTKLWYALGGILLAMPVFLLLFSGVTVWLLDILPANSYIFIVLFWLLGVVCFFLWSVRNKSVAEKPEMKKRSKWLPLCLFGVLIVCMLFCMWLRFYPISSSLNFIMQTKDITDIITEEISLERQLAYWRNEDTWIHPIIVAGCAFILAGWQTKCLQVPPVNWQNERPTE